MDDGGERRVMVVGVDGSAESTNALRWAGHELAPGDVLHVVHAIAPAEELAADRAVELAEAWIPSAVDDDGPATIPAVREGTVADVLLDVAHERGADAIVVGHHPQSRLGPQLVGHVTVTLLHASDVPVVIVPVDWTPARTDGRPVVVGVGVSHGTRAALRWAIARADIARRGLVLAHAHGPRSLFRPDGWLDVLAYHLDPRVLPEWIERDLEELGEQLVAETGADVEVSVSVEPGRTGPRLVEAGEEASLLVIGRGEPPFVRNHAIAPYLRHAISHAPCPIVVVPAAEA